MNSLIALAHLARDSSNRKAVVWVAQRAYFAATDVPSFWADARPYEKPLLPMYEAMIEELNAARVSVYPIIDAPSAYYNVNLLGLRQVAECTAGLTLNHQSIIDAVQSVLTDFGPYYMLAVDAPAPKELDWMPVKIKVSRPGVTVRAAPGFLGLKPLKTK